MGNFEEKTMNLNLLREQENKRSRRSLCCGLCVPQGTGSLGVYGICSLYFILIGFLFFLIHSSFLKINKNISFTENSLISMS